tara:strand:- start:1993 stop:2337 length:345 start_codon:yes stop_codon:yes gene_type:complete
MKTPEVPRFAVDLIEMLDETTLHPEFPNTIGGVAGLTEPALRRLAYAAGRRSLVDDLLGALTDETQDTDDIVRGPVLGRVLDTNGREHTELASVHLAEGGIENGDAASGRDFHN